MLKTNVSNSIGQKIWFAKEKVITIAGNKQAKAGHQDGAAQDSLFDHPNNITIHKNLNVLFVGDSDNHVIRRIDISFIDCGNSNHSFEFLVSTVCGNPQQSGFEDGVGNEAKLSWPTGMAFSKIDENLLYFCDSENNCIRTVNVLTKLVSTIVGNPIQAGFKDGIGNEAQFGFPFGICVDKNENLFVCDNWNHSIRKISFRSNPTESPQSHVIVATLFGNQLSNGMKEGNKSIATLNRPQSILFDKVSNCLIFTQENSIRQIKLGKSFMEWKLTTIFFIYRILLKQCEESISKRLLLQLISFQILQSSTSNETENPQMRSSNTKTLIKPEIRFKGGNKN